MVGSLVLNRFLIERRIGSGGFGVVYEAWDGRLERPVAVKAIEQRGEAGRRVLREAQAAARLNHPGIVTLYEMGEEDGNALLVSELVEGSTLARLAHAGELSDREIGEIGADLCEALDHAHSRGVVHRDIKPQNVQVTEGECEGESRAKLMDFGVAHLADGASLTAPGDVVGTLAYMSPGAGRGPRRRPRGRRLLAGADALRVLERREPAPPRQPGGDGAGDRRPHPAAAPPAPRPAARADRRDRRLPRRPPQPPSLAGAARHARSRTRSTSSPSRPRPATATSASASVPSPSPPPSAPGSPSATASFPDAASI